MKRYRVIAWLGNMLDTYYIVPDEDVEWFLSTYNDPDFAPWQVVPHGRTGGFILERNR